MPFMWNHFRIITLLTICCFTQNGRVQQTQIVHNLLFFQTLWRWGTDWHEYLTSFSSPRTCFLAPKGRFTSPSGLVTTMCPVHLQYYSIILILIKPLVYSTEVRRYSDFHLLIFDVFWFRFFRLLPRFLFLFCSIPKNFLKRIAFSSDKFDKKKLNQSLQLWFRHCEWHRSSLPKEAKSWGW